MKNSHHSFFPKTEELMCVFLLNALDTAKSTLLNLVIHTQTYSETIEKNYHIEEIVNQKLLTFLNFRYATGDILKF